MRRLLGPLVPAALAALLLAGCGDDAGVTDTADDPAPTSSTSPASPEPAPSSETLAPPEIPPEIPTDFPTDLPTDLPTKAPPITPSTGPGGVAFELVALEHETAAGGQVQLEATQVGPDGDTGAILGQLTDPQFRELVEQRITFSRVQGDLYAAVVAVGCDVPPGVSVAEAGDGYAIVPDKVPNPTPECFAPVTTVAVVAVQE